MIYAPKGDARDKEDERASQHERTTGRCSCHRRRRSSVRSTYASALSRLAEAEYRPACCTTTGTRPSSLFLTIFPHSPLPSLLPTTLVTIALASRALFFTLAVAYPPPSSPLPSPLSPSPLLPSSLATRFCCLLSPAVVLVCPPPAFDTHIAS